MTALAKSLHYWGLLTLVLGPVAAAEEPQRWWQEPKGRPPEQLAQIVGGDGALWKIAGVSGKPAEYGIETVDGHPVLITRGLSTILTSSMLYSPDTEIVVRFRMASTDLATSVVVQAGLQNPADAKESGLRISVNSARSVENCVTWQVADPLAAPYRGKYVQNLDPGLEWLMDADPLQWVGRRISQRLRVISAKRAAAIDRLSESIDDAPDEPGADRRG